MQVAGLTAPGALQMPDGPGWHAVANIPCGNLCLAAVLAFLTSKGPEIFIVSMELDACAIGDSSHLG